MKKILSLFAALLLSSFCFAQLPDGSVAPDFTLYEINKTTGEMETDHTINLYSILNDYKTVFIDVSASTCGPCQSFHQTGTLSSLITNFGAGTTDDDTRVLFIEGAQSGNSWASISGQTGSTWNVTEGANYPVIPLYISPNTSNASSFHSGYSIAYFPTIYMVCPNRVVYNMSRDGSNQAVAWHTLAEQTCPNISNQNAAMFFASSFNPEPVYFCSYNITPQIKMQNLGSETMTSAVLTMTHGNDIQTINWTGNLAQFETEYVNFNSISGSEGGIHNLHFEITEVNGVPNEEQTHSAVDGSFNVVSEATASTLEADFSAGELPTGWNLVDNCDGYYGYYNGAFYFYAFYISSGGSAEMYLPMLDFSNMSTPWMQFDVAYKQYQSSSQDKLQVKVSNDCGQTWQTPYSKAGTALKTGNPTTSAYVASANDYRTDCVDLAAAANASNVLVKFVFTSGYGNNIWLNNIKVVNQDISSVESVEDASELTVYPVPAGDVLNIDYNKAIKQIEIYDMNGRLVKSFGHVEKTISVVGLATGSYIMNIKTEDGIVVKNFVKE